MTADPAENDDTSEIIYLDNAATTFPKPACVYEAADKFYRRWGGNAGRGGNPLARAGTRLLADTREQLAAWLNAPSPQQVIFAPSATHALNLAILGVPLKSGDAVYATPFEHNSVLRPLEHLRQSKGVQIHPIPFSRRTYTCQFEQLTTAFQVAPPALVCVTQASNVCGIMLPVTEIARLAKEANPRAVVVIDGAQTAGLYPLPLTNGLIDALIFSGHKSLYGPYGVAGLVLASDWRPPPLLFGGTGTMSESIQMPSDLPSVYEAGSHNIWAIAGLQAALSWLEETGREVIVEHTTRLAWQLREGLADLPGVELHLPPEETPWCGILSFTVEDITPQSVEAALGAQNIAVRAGLHCAPWVHQWLGTIAKGGMVRVSIAHFTQTEDLQAFLSVVEDITTK